MSNASDIYLTAKEEVPPQHEDSEASPRYETYETTSIFGTKRMPEKPPRYDKVIAINRPSSLGSRVTTFECDEIKLRKTPRQRSSVIVSTGSRDPLICPVYDTDRSYPLDKIYDRAHSEVNRMVLHKLNRYEKVPRIKAASDGTSTASEDDNQTAISTLPSSDREKLTFFPSFMSYGDDLGERIERNRRNPGVRRDEPKVEIEDLVITKHVCNCDILGGKTHIHKIGPQKGVNVPCIQKSDSLTDSELDIGLSRRSRCSKRWCICLLVALLFVALGSAAIIYFAYQFIGLKAPHEMVYRGSMRVEGPLWNVEYEDRRSPAYRATLQEYKGRLDMIYGTSVFKKAFIRSEVFALERGPDDSLIVHFNLHINHLRLKMDGADLFLVLMSEIRRQDSHALAGIVVDEDSVVLQERVNSPSVLPPHLEKYDEDITEERYNAAIGLRPLETQLRATTSSTTTPPPRVCSGLELKLCTSLHHNVTTYPNILGHKNLQEIEADLIAVREVIDSECHTLAFEFLCEVLQPDCHKYSQPTPRGTFEDEMVYPCKDFCDDVVSACGSRLPTRLRNLLKCEDFPPLTDGKGCTAKPGCTRELRVMGWPERVCDGVVDCEDMSDEDQCSDCAQDGFRCGSGLGCVFQAQRCDGINDCTNGADEKGCLSLTPTPTDRDSAKGDRWTKYNREGLLRYTEAGKPYRVCVDNINKTLSTPEANQLIHNMAEVTCANFTYGGVDLVEVVTEDVFDHVPGLGYVQIADVFTRNITFQPVNCTRRTVVFISCSELACGMRPLYVPPKDAVVERIVRTTGSGDWPWVAALLKDGVHACDATLVHPLWLITTSLCFKGVGRALWVARLGTTRISSKAPWVQERLIIGMVKSDVTASELVLIKLEKNIVMSDYVRPACLGSHRDPTMLTTRRCRALGWGARRDPLLELSVSVDSLSCDILDPDTATGASFCARQISPTDRCLMEEMNGAGLLCEWADRWEVVGIATGRSGCENGARPRVYDNVSPETVNWIKKTISAFERRS